MTFLIGMPPAGKNRQGPPLPREGIIPLTRLALPADGDGWSLLFSLEYLAFLGLAHFLLHILWVGFLTVTTVLVIFYFSTLLLCPVCLCVCFISFLSPPPGFPPCGLREKCVFTRAFWLHHGSLGDILWFLKSTKISSSLIYIYNTEQSHHFV